MADITDFAAKLHGAQLVHWDSGNEQLYAWYGETRVNVYDAGGYLTDILSIDRSMVPNADSAQALINVAIEDRREMARAQDSHAEQIAEHWAAVRRMSWWSLPEGSDGGR